MSEFKVQRLGLVMQPEAGNPLEVEGVLNPAAVRGRDGHLYLFPRLVAAGNYSRIGIARVVLTRLGIRPEWSGWASLSNQKRTMNCGLMAEAAKIRVSHLSSR